MDLVHTQDVGRSPALRGALLLIGLALLCNIVLIANLNGLYFEDFSLYGRTTQQIAQIFSNRPIFYEKDLMVILHTFLNLQYWRITNFIFNTAGAVAIYFTLRNIPTLNDNEAFSISALYVALPLYMARISVLMLPRAIISCVFYFSFYLLARILVQEKAHLRLLTVAQRIISLALFMLVLEFTAIIPLYYVSLFVLLLTFRTTSDGPWFSWARQAIFRFPDYWILPVISGLLKVTITAPRGAYDSLYKVTPNGILLAFLKTPDFMLHSLLGTLDVSQLTDNALPFTIILAGLITLGVLAHRTAPFPGSFDFSATRAWLMCGAALSCAAIFPYLAAGKPVLFVDWDSRNQYLLPLGISVIIFSLFKAVIPKKNLPVVLAALLCWGIVIDNQTWATFYREWVKQCGFAYQTARNPAATNCYAFLVQDRCTFINALKREIQPLEYHSLLRRELPDGPHKIFYSLEYDGTLSNQWPWIDFNVSTPPDDLHICELHSVRTVSLFDGSMLTLWWTEMTDPDFFRKCAATYFAVKIYPAGDLLK